LRRGGLRPFDHWVVGPQQAASATGVLPEYSPTVDLAGLIISERAGL
jgi:hypothetical protein